MLSRVYNLCLALNNECSLNPDLTKVKSNERKIYDSENRYKALPPEIRDRFLTCLNHTFLKPLCFCMMLAGLRTGETLALQWKDIDFENKNIKVERAITIVPKFDSNGKVISRKTVISDTKTICSKRVVPMPDILVNALKEYYELQQEKSSQYNFDFVDKESFVFCNNDGEIRSYGGTKKIFYTFLKSHNLNKYHIHFHTLRHTFSNTLFEADQNPKVIQSLLGHKDVKTTITTYNSVDKSYFDKATKVFNEQYKIEQQEDKYDSLDDDELDWELEQLLKEKEERERRK